MWKTLYRVYWGPKISKDLVATPKDSDSESAQAESEPQALTSSQCKGRWITGHGKEGARTMIALGPEWEGEDSGDFCGGKRVCTGS